MILIIGLCKSGTSFVAECFRDAGMDPGGAWVPASNAGWEYMPLHTTLLALIKAGIRFPSCEEAVALLEKHPSLTGISENAPRVVKTPLFAPMLEVFVHMGVVERVIQPMRPVEDILRSRKVWHAGSPEPYTRPGEDQASVLLAALDYVDETVARHRLARARFRFPQCYEEGGEGEDFEALAKELTIADVSMKKARNVIRRTKRPDTRKVLA